MGPDELARLYRVCEIAALETIYKRPSPHEPTRGDIRTNAVLISPLGIRVATILEPFPLILCVPVPRRLTATWDGSDVEPSRILTDVLEFRLTDMYDDIAIYCERSRLSR